MFTDVLADFCFRRAQCAFCLYLAMMNHAAVMHDASVMDHPTMADRVMHWTMMIRRTRLMFGWPR